MSDQYGSLPTPLRLGDWAATLPSLAFTVVSGADVTRPHIYSHVPASSAQVSVLRHQVMEWARRIGLGESSEQDVVLATDEAVSNAVEHAYPDAPGSLTLFAACTRLTGTVRIIVSDHGVWRPPAKDPGYRGRGLLLMERLADVFRVVHSSDGTTVVLGWSPTG